MSRFLQSWALGLCALAAVIAPRTAEARTPVLVLSAADETAYARAFAAASRGDAAAVRSALPALEDDSLAAHVSGRLLLGADRRSADAFRAWLGQHADHPLAGAVAARATSLRIDRLPQRPAAPHRRANPSAAAGRDDALGPVAALFGAGDLEAARQRALPYLQGPHRTAAAWWLGLTAWRQGDWASAGSWFDQAALSPNPWSQSAARYWQGRAALARGQAEAAIWAFTAAAAHPATFYGQLAEVQIGRDSSLDLDLPGLSEEEMLAFILRWPQARRAAALAQLGRLSDVELELRDLHARLPPVQDRAFLAFAAALAAPAAQLRAAEHGGPEVAAGYCPTTTFAPDNGFRLDRALLFAVVRQESRFSPVARSSSNAKGLMQLLPSTARDLDDQAAERLHDPAANMRLGQQYLEWLNGALRYDGDLARMFAAYNGGPGWLARWEQGAPVAADPLLWLESLPRAEPRDYAERVLSHIALCRKRLGQPPVELFAMAEGRPARYRPLDRASHR